MLREVPSEGSRCAQDRSWRRPGGAWVWTAVALVCLRASYAGAAGPELSDVIQRIKSSVVAVGTYERTRSPAFSFRGTGFVVGDGSLVATNAHVLPPVIDDERREALVVAIPGPTPTSPAMVRTGKTLVIDQEHDLALVRIDGPKLPALVLGDSGRVREGQSYLFTGFPIGAVLGLIPATHRAMVSALTPIAIPTGNAQELEPRAIKRLATSPYPVMQLDGTAYPGNSGSPLYDPETGDVVGIVNSVFVKATRESALSQPSGISFAIPAQPLKNLLQSNK
jgi:serine protease Do